MQNNYYTDYTVFIRNSVLKGQKSNSYEGEFNST